ncbi:hypothetical protein OIU85_023243 [Salix viminalis]|uniref:Uncharacterized protein n=1 Tax=Salix viminalis TaxID=40686 RepID=A0A9Q0TY88_SALVM|nr:hypothetical protein OIU85_023243 [Salix viminalis]
MLHQGTANLNVIPYGSGLAVALVQALTPTTCAAAIAFLEMVQCSWHSFSPSICPTTTFSTALTQHIEQLVVLEMAK